ncbi:hypothetical protein ACGF1Z_09175 [Streptomyces sp. NPDC048018]|uniref:hypothetical protein n=1 Tax=Streptomyces sp. NPDC048018 TaxID=3365499 RepID=UPI0037231729
MTTVLFVHGTGVREPGFTASVERVRQGLRPLRPEVVVTPCYWGGSAGSALHANGASVPGYGTGRGAPGGGLSATGTEDGEQDEDIELWGLLYLDPLLELRLVASESTGRRELAPGAPPPGEALSSAALSLAGDASLRGLLDAAGIGEDFASAVAAVLTSPDGRGFLRTPAAAAGTDVLARAFVAEAIGRRTERNGSAAAFDGTARDEAVARIVALLPGDPSDEAGTHRGPVTRRLRHLTGRLALGLASAQVVKRRSALTDAAHPAAGDVLLYLSRGAAIREIVAEAVRAAEPPVVLLAHSLGGIAALDLLVLRQLPEVALLVTVGSQAPFLYELGALPSLEHGSPLPAHVPRWLNVYDRRDLLGYVGAGVFPGRVDDVALDSRQPFPLSHSAYWSNPELYRLLAAELP